MGPLERLDAYSVILQGPSSSDRGSVPLGNGVLCASVWVTATGLSGYLSRSDALTELDRTVKVCGFQIDLDIPPWDDTSVLQHLRLRDGILEITTTSGLTIEVFVDAQHDVLLVNGRSPEPIGVSAGLVVWRRSSNSAVGSSGLYDVTDRDLWEAPDGFRDVLETADVVEASSDGITVMHSNGRNIIAPLAALHGLADHVSTMPDLLTGRRFGAFLSTTNEHSRPKHGLHLPAAREFELKIATRSSQGESPSEWHDSIRRTAEAPGSGSESRERTRLHWNGYWTTSWIDVAGDESCEPRITATVLRASESEAPAAPAAASSITRAYVLTKWMTACASGGPLPIPYNGSLFTVMPGAGKHLSLDNFAVAFTAPPEASPTVDLNPDERSWTVENLWQNLRLPYHSMMQRGEHKSLHPVFEYYRRFWDLNRVRALLHHGAQGQWNTEMTLTFGLQGPAVYGTDRASLPDGYAVNRWGGAIDLSPGLELVDLMFDYYKHTNDMSFLTTELLPYAEDLVAFITDRYMEDEDGLSVGPINCLETYWDTINPLPIVAGLHALAQNLARVEPEHLVGFQQLRSLGRALPPLPMRHTDHGEVLAPAAQYTPERKNVESPELYAVFPFRLNDSVDHEVLDRTLNEVIQIAGIGRPTEMGEPVGTPSYSGWQYLGPVYALMGRIDEAADVLSNNAALANPGYRFPAMWGPIYDAVPDVDHGANILNTLQLMLLQVSGPAIRVLPAWPRHWDVSCRLYADASTVVDLEVVDGSIRILTVTPAHRRDDVILPAWAH